MILPIVFRPLAELELDEATAWYKSRKRGLETEFRAEVNQMLERIASTPTPFRPVRGGIRRALLRRFPYAIHFFEEPQAIVILAAK